ncbi:hypothetical protein AAHC03_01359 [Spirometra sp. Aus1]
MLHLTYWTTIFTDAGLPHGIGQKYAHLFVENRMTTKLLPFLDKDLLKEIGITAVGDIIAILQHCKKIKHEEPTKLKAAVTVSSTTPHLDKDVKKPRVPPGHELPVPERRTVSREIEGTYKVKLPQGTTEKTRRILQKVKLGSSNSAVKETSPPRIVILNAVSSSSKPESAAQPPTDIDGSDDDAEDVEVILSSSNPCVRTANFAKPSTKSSVFNRLGAELSQASPPQRRLKPVTTHLTRFLPSNLDSQTVEAADASQKHSSPRRTGLKRTASESVFSRLGSGMEQQRTQDAATSASNEGSLSYIGVFKHPRTSAPPQLPRVPSVDISQRPSAKSRLGTLASDAIGPRRVQDRLGSHNRTS